MEANNRMTETPIRFLAALVLLLALPLAASAAKVYRWVDENGEVHYSETLPPNFQDKGHDILSDQGMVLEEGQKLTPEPPPETPNKEEPQELPRDASGLPRPKALYSEAEMQRRMDNFLMLRYESEQEILDAMEVEIKQLNYDRRLLEGSRNSTQTAWRGQVRQAAERQRAGLEVPPETAREIRKLSANLAENSKSLDSLQLREDSIRADFEKQLARYRILMETGPDDTSGR